MEVRSRRGLQAYAVPLESQPMPPHTHASFCFFQLRMLPTSSTVGVHERMSAHSARHLTADLIAAMLSQFSPTCMQE